MMMQGYAKANMFEPAALDRYAEAWANAELEFVEDASHWLHVERPERIDARIMA